MFVAETLACSSRLRAARPSPAEAGLLVGVSGAWAGRRFAFGLGRVRARRRALGNVSKVVGWQGVWRGVSGCPGAPSRAARPRLPRGRRLVRTGAQALRHARTTLRGVLLMMTAGPHTPEKEAGAHYGAG
jgi:hypothetical protein